MKHDFHGIEVNTGQKLILEYLLKQKHSKSSYDICKATNKSWYYTFHLLRVLKDRGLVKSSRAGYAIRKSVFKI